MTYRLYIYIITQLATRKFVLLPIGSHTIIFRLDEEKGEWSFSLKLGAIHKKTVCRAMRDCFITRSSAHFFPGSHLTIDSIEGPGLYLVKKHPPVSQYRIFKDLIEQLMQEADDFKELLELT